MNDILALLACFDLYITATTLRQMSRVITAMQTMTGRVAMLTISRWTERGASCRTVQRFFYSHEAHALIRVTLGKISIHSGELTLPDPLPPSLPLPDSLRGMERGTFTEDTVSRRLPGIARRAVGENRFPDAINAALIALADDMPGGMLTPLDDPGAPDLDAWNRDLQPYLGQPWLEAPWFTAETYFFRRVIQATGYYQGGLTYHIDPYQQQKTLGLETNRPAILDLASLLESVLNAGDREGGLRVLLAAALWGNRSDLSLWPAEEGQANHSHHQPDAYLLADHRDALTAYLLRLGGKGRAEIITDNAGIELAADLALADFLLAAGIVEAVRLNLKAHPTYVSDAMQKEVFDTLAFLRRLGVGAADRWAYRLQADLADGRLILHDDYFWTSPRPFWEMPARLRDAFSGAALLISKGDANYRRLHGDRHWPPAAPFEAVVSYSPAPLLALRTCKAEMISGLPEGRAEELDRIDPDWLVNGRWGVIQFAGPGA
jgi:uncharacterized protein with ATP-grasp and redox domains